MGAAALVMACVAGCEQGAESEPEVPVAPADSSAKAAASDPKSGSAAGGATAAPRKFGEFQLRVPEDWVEAELTGMQRSVLLAKFKVPSADPDIEATISEAGGGIDANFQRWRGQFSGGDASEDTVDFLNGTARMLQLTGNFRPGFGKPDRTDWMMIGVAMPGRENELYIKLTGPMAKVLDIEEQLRAMVQSADRS